MLTDLQTKILKRLIENLPQSASQFVHLTHLDERSLVINAASGLNEMGFTRSTFPFSGVLALITEKGIEHMENLKVAKTKATALKAAAKKKSLVKTNKDDVENDESKIKKSAPKKKIAAKPAAKSAVSRVSKVNKDEIKVKIIPYDTVYNAVKKSKLLETEKNELNGMIAGVEQLLKAEKKDRRKIWLKIKGALELVGNRNIDAGLAFVLVPYFAQAMNSL